jgi:hypothetical protein
MRRAKVIATSPSPDTYVDVLAAIANTGEIDEIVLVFLGSDHNQKLITEIQKKLVELAEIQAYEQAARLKLADSRIPSDMELLLGDCTIVDVTGVPKRLAVEIAAKALTKSRIKVCDLRWLDPIEGQTRLRVGKNAYSYADLLSESTLRAVRKDYVAKQHVIIVFGLIFGVATALAIAQLVFGWGIPDKWINILSLLVGVGGLQLAYVSLKRI